MRLVTLSIYFKFDCAPDGVCSMKCGLSNKTWFTHLIDTLKSNNSTLFLAGIGTVIRRQRQNFDATAGEDRKFEQSNDRSFVHKAGGIERRNPPSLQSSSHMPAVKCFCLNINCSWKEVHGGNLQKYLVEIQRTAVISSCAHTKAQLDKSALRCKRCIWDMIRVNVSTMHNFTKFYYKRLNSWMQNCITNDFYKFLMHTHRTKLFFLSIYAAVIMDTSPES